MHGRVPSSDEPSGDAIRPLVEVARFDGRDPELYLRGIRRAHPRSARRSFGRGVAVSPCIRGSATEDMHYLSKCPIGSAVPCFTGRSASDERICAMPAMRVKSITKRS